MSSGGAGAVGGPATKLCLVDPAGQRHDEAEGAQTLAAMTGWGASREATRGREATAAAVSDITEGLHGAASGRKTAAAVGDVTEGGCEASSEGSSASEGSLEAVAAVRGLETTAISRCGGLEPAGIMTRGLERDDSSKKGRLDTALMTMRGLETTSTVEGALESPVITLGSMGTTNPVKGVQKINSNRKRGLERAGIMPGLRTTTTIGESQEDTMTMIRDLETANTNRKRGLETVRTKMKGLGPVMTLMGGLEDTMTMIKGLDSAGPVKGGPGTTNACRKRGLETAVMMMRGLEMVSANKKGRLEPAVTMVGDLETGSPVEGDLETVNISRERGLETDVTVMGEMGMASTNKKGRLQTTMTMVGGLEDAMTTIGGLKPASPVTGSLETAATVLVDLGMANASKKGLEGSGEPSGSPDTAVDCPEGRRKRKAEEAVISVEEEEEDEEEGGPGGQQVLKMEQYLDALEAVQLQLEEVNARAACAYQQLRTKFGHLRRPHLEHRNLIIQNITGFWVTAFLNHPQLSALINDRDEDTLSYMTNLQVEDSHTKPSCKIKFYFSKNPYFQNEVIVKEFQHGSSGRLMSHATPIRWWQGQDPQLQAHKLRNTGCSFFHWFGDHSFPAGDRIAEIIKEDLWPNPLQYYLMGEGGEHGDDSETENGEDCVVIVDDDGEDEVQEILDEDEEGGGSSVEEVMEKAAVPESDSRGIELEDG
ncbi:testis-specific Y-encoded-like protein 2 [Alligator sinensis]|uniref:Testis-specific Y-encoded-like protein 2 n=1 Tax=Alligator sinensis TaxID=38654 RepID=A0A3Q0HFX0_ALLSI|nr:testis-specific Y-encoded-like protein 2 [Alligator sinensis]